MSAKEPPPTDQNSFLAGIGHVCLQWSLLEQTVLAIIASAEDTSFDKVYTRFGGLDMQQRLNMAIKLTREEKWPNRLTKPLVTIRRAIQRDGEGLAETRNMFVHGAHKDTAVPGEFSLTMSRWSPDKRHQIVTLLDAIQLANRLAELVQQAVGVFRNYGTWKFGTKDHAERGYNVAETKALSRFIRAQNIKRAIKLLFANLKPW